MPVVSDGAMLCCRTRKCRWGGPSERPSSGRRPRVGDRLNPVPMLAPPRLSRRPFRGAPALLCICGAVLSEAPGVW